jgi:hypothetical protein
MMQATGIPHSYTLECNYQSGKRINHLTSRYNKLTGQVEKESSITDPTSKLYTDTKTPNYNIEVFEDIGRATCIALLDYIEVNPISRLITSNYKTLEVKSLNLIVGRISKLNLTHSIISISQGMSRKKEQEIVPLLNLKNI